MDFLFYGYWMKFVLMWYIYDGLDVIVRSLGEMWLLDSVIIDKNEMRWIDVEVG